MLDSEKLLIKLLKWKWLFIDVVIVENNISLLIFLSKKFSYH